MGELQRKGEKSGLIFDEKSGLESLFCVCRHVKRIFGGKKANFFLLKKSDQSKKVPFSFSLPPFRGWNPYYSALVFLSEGVKRRKGSKAKNRGLR